VQCEMLFTHPIADTRGVGAGTPVPTQGYTALRDEICYIARRLGDFVARRRELEPSCAQPHTNLLTDQAPSAAVTNDHTPGVGVVVVDLGDLRLKLVSPLDAKALQVDLELLQARRADDGRGHKRP